MPFAVRKYMRSGFLNVLIFTLTCRFTAILFFQGTDDEVERLDDFLCRDVVRVVPFLFIPSLFQSLQCFDAGSAHKGEGGKQFMGNPAYFGLFLLFVSPFERFGMQEGFLQEGIQDFLCGFPVVSCEFGQWSKVDDGRR